MVYRGHADFNGEEQIAIAVSDGELDGELSDSQTIAVTVTPVNDAPILTVPNSLTVAEGVELNLSGITVSDIDVGEGELEVTVAANNGVLSLTSIDGLSFSNGDSSEDDTLTFTGSLEAINNALAGLVYRGHADFFGEDEITITVSDLGNTGAGEIFTDSQLISITVIPDVIATSSQPPNRPPAFVSSPVVDAFINQTLCF